jgi:hypothetical protein
MAVSIVDTVVFFYIDNDVTSFFWLLHSTLQFLILINWLAQKMQLMRLSYGEEHVLGL